VGHNTPSWNPDDFPWGNKDKEIGFENSKYPFIYHAEQIAINNYRGNRSDLEGATMYVTLYPCKQCAASIALAGIKKVVYLNCRLYDEIDISRIIMEKNNIKILKLKMGDSKE